MDDKAIFKSNGLFLWVADSSLDISNQGVYYNAPFRIHITKFPYIQTTELVPLKPDGKTFDIDDVTYHSLQPSTDNPTHISVMPLNYEINEIQIMSPTNTTQFFFQPAGSNLPKWLTNEEMTSYERATIGGCSLLKPLAALHTRPKRTADSIEHSNQGLQNIDRGLQQFKGLTQASSMNVDTTGHLKIPGITVTDPQGVTTTILPQKFEQLDEFENRFGQCLRDICNNTKEITKSLVNIKSITTNQNFQPLTRQAANR